MWTDILRRRSLPGIVKTKPAGFIFEPLATSLRFEDFPAATVAGSLGQVQTHGLSLINALYLAGLHHFLINFRHAGSDAVRCPVNGPR